MSDTDPHACIDAVADALHITDEPAGAARITIDHPDATTVLHTFDERVLIRGFTGGSLGRDTDD